MICRLCYNDGLRLYYRQGNKKQFNYFKCKNCGLVNLDLNSTNIFANQDKYEFEHNFPDPKDPFINKGSLATYNYLKQKTQQVGSFLDIGCGNGSLLFLAQQGGWQTEGIELSGFLADEVKKELGIQVTAINFMDIENFEKTYDLVALRHVLEHIPDSVPVMNKINSLLNPGGKALLEFPNIEGISFKFKRFLERTGIRTKKYKEDYLPGHCNEFSYKSFKYLLSKTGFELIEWTTYSSGSFGNLINKMLPVGTKARALIIKKI